MKKNRFGRFVSSVLVVSVALVLSLALTICVSCELVPPELIEDPAPHSNPDDPEYVDPDAPVAVLTGLPAEITNETSISIIVGGKDIVSYKYSLDTGDYSEEKDISTQIAVSGLSDGDHTLAVRGKDSTDTWQPESQATTYAWTIDTSTITVVLTGAPATFSREISLEIIVGGTNVSSYSYRFDAGSWSGETSLATAISLTGLTETTHTLEVIGKNSHGIWQEESDAAVCTWTVDHTAPVAVPTISAFSPVYITSGSAAVGVTGADESEYIVVFRYDSDLTPSWPVDGTAYAAGDQPASECEVVYQGSGSGFSGFTDSDVPEGIWKYQAYNHDAAMNYGGGSAFQDLRSYRGSVYVRHNEDAGNSGTIDDPLPSIQGAIDLINTISSVDLREIRVAGDTDPSEYYGPETAGQPVVTLSDDITIRGGYNPADWSDRDETVYSSIIHDTTVAASLSETVFGDGVSGVIFDGLEIIGSDTAGGDYDTYAVSLSECTGIEFVRCRITGGSTNTVNAYSYGIYAVSSDIDIHDNHYIHGGGGYYSFGILSTGTGGEALIRGNEEIRGGAPYTPTASASRSIMIGATSAAEIEGNTIYAVDDGFTATASSTCIDVSSAGVVVIKGNVIFGSGSSSTAMSILLSSSSIVYVHNNFIYTDGASSVYAFRLINTPVKIRNNTIYLAGVSAGFSYGMLLTGYSGSTTLNIDNNIIHGMDSADLTTYGIYASGFGFSGLSGFSLVRNNFDGLDFFTKDSTYEYSTIENVNGINGSDTNLNEELAVEASDGQVSGDPASFDFDTYGRNGAYSGYSWEFTDDITGTARTGSGTVGWSMGCYEYD